MIVLIDAYNVLRFYSPEVVSEGELRSFCLRMHARCALKGYQALIICDGGSSGRPTVEDRGLVQLWYAGRGRTADELIESLSEQYRGQECVVISADRSLCNAVRARGACCISPQELWNVLHEKPKAHVPVPSSAQRVHRYGIGPSAMDALLHDILCQKVPHKQDEDIEEDRCSSPMRIGRAEKRHRKIVEKL